jgi:uncharacterized protein YggE
MNLKSTGGIFVLTILSLFAIKLLDISYPLKMTIANAPQDLAVVGEGKVDVVPDTAYVDVGITINNASTVEEARNKVDTVNTLLIAEVKKLGLDPKEIKTTNYSVYPQYTYEGNTNRITGYDGHATITVKTKKTELVPLIIEEATQAGANQINNTRFVVDNPAIYREEARAKAIKNAKDQAEKIAKSLGIKLGKVTNVVESISGGIVPQYDMMYSTKSMPVVGGGGGGPELEAGSETVSSTVTLYFEKR